MIQQPVIWCTCRLVWQDKYGVLCLRILHIHVHVCMSPARPICTCMNPHSVYLNGELLTFAILTSWLTVTTAEKTHTVDVNFFSLSRYLCLCVSLSVSLSFAVCLSLSDPPLSYLFHTTTPETHTRTSTHIQKQCRPPMGSLLLSNYISCCACISLSLIIYS